LTCHNSKIKNGGGKTRPQIKKTKQFKTNIKTKTGKTRKNHNQTKNQI